MPTRIKRRPSSSRTAHMTLERAEPRWLLAGFSGVVFNDLDRDGVRDAGEAGLSGVTVFADYDYDAKVDAGEPTVLTNASGAYALSVPLNRSLALRAALPAGATSTAPAGGAFLAKFRDDYVLTNRNLGLALPTPPAGTGTVTGRVYGDMNRNGVQDAGDLIALGQGVYVDIDYDGVQDAGEPTGFTDVNGFYSIGGIPLSPKSVAIRLMGVLTASITAPAGGFHSSKFATAYTAPNRNFGVAPPSATVTGKVEIDRPEEQGGRAPIPGRIVFVDLDGDDSLDDGEQSTQTDASGNYTLLNVPVGPDVAVRTLYAASAFLSPTLGEYAIPFSDPVTADFLFKQGTASGRVFLDTDRNSTIEAGETTPAVGAIIFNDYDGDGVIDETEARVVTDANGYFVFNANVTEGTIRSVPPALPSDPTVPSGNFVQTTFVGFISASSSLSSLDRRVVGGFFASLVNVLPQVPLASDFSNGSLTNDMAAEIAYRFNGQTTHAWLDYDGDGVRDAGEDLVPNFWDDSDQLGDPRGYFLIAIAGDTYRVSIGFDSAVGTTAVATVSIVGAAGNGDVVVLRPEVPLNNALAIGRIFHDENGNGVIDVESAAQGEVYDGEFQQSTDKSVFADLDFDNFLDPGEITAAVIDFDALPDSLFQGYYVMVPPTDGPFDVGVLDGGASLLLTNVSVGAISDGEIHFLSDAGYALPPV